MKVLLICGSRNWSDPEAIGREIEKRKPDMVLNGGGGDADMYASTEARKRGIHAIEVEALWDVHGRSAGPWRNAWMTQILAAFAKGGCTVQGIAFAKDIDTSRGTKDMVDRLRRADIPCEVFTK